MYHLDRSVVNTTLGFLAALCSLCVRVCVLLRVSCVPALFVDPGPCRLLNVAGGTSKAEEQSSKELQPRQESENPTEFEGTVTRGTQK